MSGFGSLVARFSRITEPHVHAFIRTSASGGEGGRILDVGCSFGFFLDAARKRGWDTVGLDIGEYAARFARA